MKKNNDKVLEKHKIGENFLVIYNWDYLNNDTDPPISANVKLVDKNGNTIWTVNGMEKSKRHDFDGDVFVGANPVKGTWELIAFSDNSFLLDMKTGEVTFFSYYKR